MRILLFWVSLLDAWLASATGVRWVCWITIYYSVLSGNIRDISGYQGISTISPVIPALLGGLNSFIWVVFNGEQASQVGQAVPEGVERDRWIPSGTA